MKNFPAVSVIVPVFNAERFIGACLKSFLTQTFTDFELIVVDDCSTDNSVAVAESFREQFGGRLKLMQTETNSGGAALPRNIGLELARGEYVFFADADDFVLETALEILYAAATNAKADVVYTPKYYMYNADGTVDFMTDEETANNPNDEMTLTVGEHAELCRRQINGLFHMACMKFVARKLLTENAVAFPQITSGEDFLWSIHVAWCAERFLRLPIPLYFYRANAESVTLKQRSARKQISACARDAINGMEAVHALSKKIPLLQSEPFELFVAQKYLLNTFLYRTASARAQLSAKEMYEIFHGEFSTGNVSATVPLFLTVIDAQQAKLSELEAAINRLTRKE